MANGCLFAEQRRRMVDRQLRSRGIRDERVLAAMLAVPRHEFVPEGFRYLAYEDEPVSIGCGQTISQPYMVALMAQCLDLNPSHRVLEVGAGCGYHAAVLGALAGSVVTIELIPELAAMAHQNLERTGRAGNIRVLCSDGCEGCPEFAPFDAISVAAAAAGIPAALLDQLGDPGRLVIPIGAGWEQELRTVRKTGGVLSSCVQAYCRFVPLRRAELSGTARGSAPAGRT